MPDIFEYINLERQQKSTKDGIVDGILAAIAGNAISKGDPLPSVNKLIRKLGVARMTIVKALNILKERGIIIPSLLRIYTLKIRSAEHDLQPGSFGSGSVIV